MFQQRKSVYRSFFVYSTILMITVSVIFLWYINRFTWTDPEFQVMDMIYGRAYRPYVYRVLVPLLVRALECFYPCHPLIYTLIIMYLSLIAFALTIRFFVIFLWNSKLLGEVSSILSIIALFPFLIRDGKIYDFMALFLNVLGLYFLMRKKWIGYFVVFVFGCMNKETMVLLTIIFAAGYFQKLDSREYWRLFLLQVFFFCVIKITISWIFRDNPGDVAYYQLRSHLYIITHNPYYLLVYGSFAICVAIFVILDWSQKPEFLRIAATCLIPVLVPLNLLFAKGFEIRNYLDLFPVFFLLSIPSFGRILGIQSKPQISKSIDNSVV